MISTPEAIGAGSVIPAAHEAEERLEHHEPINLVPPLGEVSTSRFVRDAVLQLLHHAGLFPVEVCFSTATF